MKISFSQGAAVIKYYDADWVPSSKENAVFFTKFVKEDTGYRCSSYWVKSNKLNCRSTYSDTFFSKGYGLLVRYYENGNVQDSVCFNEDPRKNSFRFFEDGKLNAHIYYDDTRKTTVTEAFDEEGKSISNYIYLAVPEFPEGKMAWQKYVDNGIKKIKLRGIDKETVLKVIVQFVVDSTGNVTLVKVYQSSGMETLDNEAVRVIAKSPKWNPGIRFNKPVNSRMLQPVKHLILAD